MRCCARAVNRMKRTHFLTVADAPSSGPVQRRSDPPGCCAVVVSSAPMALVPPERDGDTASLVGSPERCPEVALTFRGVGVDQNALRPIVSAHLSAPTTICRSEGRLRKGEAGTVG